MFYRHTQDSTYEFTVVYMFNCQGFTASPPSTIQVKYSSDSLIVSGNFTTTLLPTSGLGVPPLEPPNMYNCTGRATSLCLQEYVYRGFWNSPAKAPDWRFILDLCCRPGPPPYSNAATNLGYGNAWTECGLNNLDFPDGSSKNWSPVFHNRRPNHPGYLTDTIISYNFRTMCEGQFYAYDLSAKEYQGDSVVYSFYIPQGNFGVSLSYINGYSFAFPFPTYNGKPTLNPQTGMLPVVAGKPTGSGVYLVGIEAREYRNDTTFNGSGFTIEPKLIGYNRRDMTFIIDDSSTCRADSAHIKDIYLDTIPADSNLQVYFSSGNLGDPNSLLRCNTLSADGSEFYIVDSSTYVAPFDTTVKIIPAISASWICQSGLTRKIRLKLSAPLICGDYYIFTKTGTDLDVIQSECGFWEPANSSAKIHTDQIDPIDLGPDKHGCIDKPFSRTLAVSSGHARYEWSTWETTNSITVNSIGTFWVKAFNNFECMSSDTLEVHPMKCVPNSLPTGGNNSPNVAFAQGINGINDGGLKIYPNPVQSYIVIDQGENYRWVRYTLLDISGNLQQLGVILEANSKVNLTDLSKGIYPLILQDAAGISQVRKITIEP